MGNVDISKQIKAQKIFKNTNEILSTGKFIAINNGYYPPYDYVKEYSEVFRNNITLTLSILENIETDNKVLLDLGCGLGISAYSYNKYLKLDKFYGMDFLQENIDYCKKNYNGQFDVMDFNDITYEDNLFDIVTGVDTLNGLVHNHIDFLNNIYRILKPNGIFTHIDLGFEEPDGYELNFKTIFDKFEKIDVTENILMSITNTIENIETLELNNQQKELILYGYNINYTDIVVNNNKYIKYIGYKGI